MLRHQQQLLGQVGHGRMVPPGPQLGAKVTDALHAGLVLDRSQELECLDAELAGLVDLALVDTDGGLVGQVAGALLGRIRVQRTDSGAEVCGAVLQAGRPCRWSAGRPAGA